MKKKRVEQQLKQIDNIPKFTQQSRSPPPKRRTDFSLFFRSTSSPSSSSSSLSNAQGLFLESSSRKEILSSLTVVTLDDEERKTKDMSKLPMVRCSNQDNGRNSFSDFVKVPVLEVETAAQNVLESKEYLSSCRPLFRSPDGTNNSNEQDQSSDKCNSSVSSRTENEAFERRRGKRTRKPKLHFDETTFSLSSSVKKVRRLRIMRYLGLTAPVGSPFSLTHV